MKPNQSKKFWYIKWILMIAAFLIGALIGLLT